MAGTATWTTTDDTRAVKKYSVALTSTAGGAVSGNANSVIGGYAVLAKVMPNLAGDQPTDLFDLTIVDAESVDILGARGGDCSNATGEYFTFDPPLYIPLNSTLDIVLANAGNAKKARVDIYIRGERN